MQFPSYKFVVSVFIRNKQDHYLFLKRAAGETLAGVWDIAGGGVETKESVFDAATRESLEETGLELLNLRLFKVRVKVGAHKKQKHYVEHWFVADSKDQDPVLSLEHAEYRWLSLEDALSLPLTDYLRPLVEELLTM